MASSFVISRYCLALLLLLLAVTATHADPADPLESGLPGDFLLFGFKDDLWELSPTDGPAGLFANGTKTNVKSIAHLAVDCVARHVYWVSRDYPRVIHRATYDGTNILAVVHNDSLSGQGEVAVDGISGNLFYVLELETPTIVVSSLRNVSAGYRPLVQVPGLSPDDSRGNVAIHPVRGTIYWVAEHENNKTAIMTAELDGSNRRALVTENADAEELVVDVEADEICWNRDSRGGPPMVLCLSLKDTDSAPRLVYQGANNESIHGLAVSADRIYWSRAVLKSVAKSGGEVRVHDILPVKIGSGRRIKGLVYVPQQCPKVTNACATENGGCSFICLPLSGGRKKCLD